MSSDILDFIPRPLPTDGGKARILRRRDNFVYRTPSAPITDHHDDLIMHHADSRNAPSDVAYSAPESDPA